MSTPNTTTINGVDVTALAREYGVDSVDPYGFSKDTYEDFVGEYADAAADVLRWLSERFCLVKKEVIRKEYESVKDTPDDCDYEEYGASWDEVPYLNKFYAEGYNRGQKNLLESLFPEIAKEVE